jgi:hypothetical protein
MSGGRVVARRAVLPITLALLGLTGCETNAERSAKLEKAALAERRAHPQESQKGVLVTRENPKVKVLSTDLVHDENGIAAVVALRNDSATPLRDAPIAITVSDARGGALYRNNAPGLDTTLVTVPLLKPHTQTIWIDDQIQAPGAPAKVSALVGEAPTASSRLPRVSVSDLHAVEDPSNGTGAEGTVRNASPLPQQKLVVYVVGRRGGRIVAAGRAVLPEVPPQAKTPFQVFFIGSPHGAKLEAVAPPTTFG